jgi:hypothetical protein
MAIPNPTTDKGNGSIVDSQTVPNSVANMAKTAMDSFMDSLYRRQKTVEDSLLQYPEDLFNTPEYRFGIRFAVYDTEGKALTEKRDIAPNTGKKLGKFVGEAVQKINPSISEETVDTFGKVGESAGIKFVPVGNLYNLLTSKETKYDASSRDTFTDAVAGLSGLTTFKTAIYLYLPGSLKYTSSFDYEDADLPNIDKIRSIQTMLNYGNVDAANEISRKLPMGVIQDAVDEFAEKYAGGKELLANFTKASQRMIENPMLVHLFKGVQRRNFSFDFVLTPRSLKEAKNIEAIVHTFRRYSHPKRSSQGRFLDFPAEFDISFIYGNKTTGEYISVPKIKKCALKSINVSYGENHFTANKPGPDKIVRPTQVKLTLEFSELMMLSRDEIEKGF